MSQIAYTVTATFTDPALADLWLNWLRDGHIAQVLAGGASSAEIVAFDGSDRSFEIRCLFPTREAFLRYERDHAPRLRAAGLRLFPTEKGVNYRRSVGLIVDRFPMS